ncbi:protein-glutamate O-methyltransferase CheR [Aliiglaciecola sp. 3_MG-2023]|uniref:CheR family methyltransferase n=1 Tax=Aliiglaciecola sp. 3_MG-2023 TaxID=3062644 RepID=UPI0026E33222|nr:protein-glutamate O-methyltransferase CheR [Aliiglaciecola sp. 3_MG-2023]MDO6691772.1 protein-glutamate O-methyltransferase CheR [Aliiglaciecola sp. 3_MG-2023]
MKLDQLAPHELSEFAEFLERQCGIVLSEQKGYLVYSRLGPLVRQENLTSISELLQIAYKGSSAQLREKVVDAMTTNETLWFRDKYPFEILSKTLLTKLASVNRKVRIWSAACSSGQEPYSIAMCIQEFKRSHPRAFPYGIEIVATDISTEMLKRAKTGKFDSISISRGLADERKNRFFKAVDNNHMQLDHEIVSMVHFKPQNLLNSYSGLGRFDVVFCRNVLIYFSLSNKRKILQQIAACLQNHGALFLGASESIAELNQLFSLERNNPGIFYIKKSN